MKSIILAITFAIFISGCSSHPVKPITVSNPVKADQDARRHWMIGKWYGKMPTTDGGYQEELIHRAADGTYEIQFKETDKNGHAQWSKEDGEWGISGDVYFTIFRGWDEEGRFHPSDPFDPANYDAYYIIKLTKSQLEYRNARTKILYEDQKVSDDFELK